MARILVVEDEQDMQFLLGDNLQAEGHEVESVGTGREGIAKGLSGEFDLMILDLMLPDIGGVEVCKRIRARNTALPVIMLTAKGDEIDKVVGLEVGADDYVTKPFGMREFLARVKAALRRSERAASSPLAECAIGDGIVDFTRREIVRGKRKEKLTRYESDLLQLLAANRRQTVTRKRILQEVWGSEPASGNRTVDNYVVKLRGKIERDPDRPELLVTVHGVGYMLM